MTTPNESNDVPPERDDAGLFVVQRNGDELILTAKHPGMPFSPREVEQMRALRDTVETTDEGDIVIPEQVEDRLDLEHGDEIHINSFVQTWTSVFVEELSEALQPMLQNVQQAFKQIAEAFQDAEFGQVDDVGDSE